MSNNKLIKSIVSLASTNQYGSVLDFVLYRHLNVSANQVADALNKLYADGFITVKAIRGYKSITPTTKALSLYKEARPVTDKQCMMVFEAVLRLEADSQYYNVSYYTLYGDVARRVGVVSFDIALAKLANVGFIKVGTPTEKLRVYSTTKAGRDSYISAGGALPNRATTAPAPSYVKKEMSEDEKAKQLILKELAAYVLIEKKYKKLLLLNKNWVFTAEQTAEYQNAISKANQLRQQLGYEIA